ncbi:MAG: hypothetical protein ACREGB_01670 [Candidatus Saccharimonadales bacterium]
MKATTLTEAWYENSRPRPPFVFLYDHPDKDHHNWVRINLITLTSTGTWFRDSLTGDLINGDDIKVRILVDSGYENVSYLDKMAKACST